MKTKKAIFKFGDSEIQTISDIEDNEYMDTTILINGSYVCTIAGNTLNEFIIKIQTIVNDYKI